jgi:uncharacterized protein with beta-barrel porin domain
MDVYSKGEYSDLTVENSGEIKSEAEEAIGIEVDLYGYEKTLTVSNTGTITATGSSEELESNTYATGMDVYSKGEYSDLTVENSGKITALSDDEAIGIEASLNGAWKIASVSNAGTITATGNEVVGIDLNSTGEHSHIETTNTGDITATGNEEATGIEVVTQGSGNGVLVINEAESTITATGNEEATGIDIDISGEAAVTDVLVVNDGEITSTVNLSDETYYASAIGIEAELGGENIMANIINSGDIIATGTTEDAIEAETYAVGMNTGLGFDNEGSLSGSEVDNSIIIIANTGEVTDENEMTTDDGGTITATGSYAVGMSVGVEGEGNNITVTNDGDISAQGEDVSYGQLAYVNTGTSEEQSESKPVTRLDMENTGTITSDATVYVTGMEMILSGEDIFSNMTNSGTITATTTSEEEENYAVGMAADIYGTDIGTEITNTGTITAEGDYATGISTSAEITDGTLTVTNAGEISVSGEEVYGIYSYGSIDGDSSIVVSNTGTIEVSGESGAGVAISGDGEFINDGTIEVSGEDVIGVDMSDANTTYVTNSGTIVSDGTAILMNSQDNEIILEGESSSITGIVDGGDGEDTLVLRDNADIDFEIENISIISVESGESHILEGTTIVLDTASDPEEGETLTPSEGTTLVIDEGSTVVLNINGEGETSRLDAATIDIDGEVIISTSFLDSVSRESLVNDEGESEYHYEYVFTGVVEGFENITVDSYVWSASEGSLILYKEDYADMTESSKLLAIAEVLENNDGNNEFETVLDQLDKINTEAEYEDALDQISGDMYAATPFMALQTTKIFEKNVKTFINLDTGKDVEQYISIIGAGGDYDGNDKSEGFDYQSFGFVGATEKNLSSKNSIGISYGYADTNVDFDDAGSSSSDIATAHVGVYHEYQGETWQVATRAAYEFNDAESERTIDYGDLDYSMESDYDINVISIGTELSTVYKTGKWEVKPLAGITYSYIDQGEIKEDGGDVLNINIDSETYNSIRSEVGVRVERETSFGSLNGLVSWNHEFGNVYDDIDATLEGASSDSYTIYGLENMEDTYTVGAGVTLGNEEALSYNINYNFTGNSEYTENTVSAGVKYTF